MLSSYKTLEETILTLVCMQIGIFNYDEVSVIYTYLLNKSLPNKIVK